MAERVVARGRAPRECLELQPTLIVTQAEYMLVEWLNRVKRWPANEFRDSKLHRSLAASLTNGCQDLSKTFS